ncbi:MAG: cytochrome c biogenesis protein CcsA [Casimicrobiaceae bacterium]
MIVAQVFLAIGYTALAWVDRPRSDSESAEPQWKPLQWATMMLIVLHAAVVWHLIVRTEGINLSFAASLSLIGLLLAVANCASSWLLPLPGMASRSLPLVAVAAILPVLLPVPHWLPYSTDILAGAHLIVALLAFSLLVIAAVQAAALLTLEKQLHRGLATVGGAVPSVLTLERWLFGLISVGFVLLTAALGSGMLFSEALFGKPASFNHKTVFSVLGWLLFGVLLAGRWRWGWRGRKALRWVVIGSILLLIGYAGSKFVLEVLLGRH